MKNSLALSAVGSAVAMLSALLLLLIVVSNASAQTVAMEMNSLGCGGIETSPYYEWQKDGRLIVWASIRENGSDHAKRKNARIAVKGNLITVTIEYLKPESDNGVLPPLCSYLTSVKFVVSALEPRNYVLLIASEDERFFYVRNTMRIDRPDK